MGAVYKLTLPGGKCYVGMTEFSVEKRVKSHLKSARSGSNLLLHKALRKREFSIASCVVLFESDNVEALIEKEIQFIRDLKTIAPGGYNLTTGGEKNKHYTQEVRKRISDAMLGTKVRVGSKHSEESKALMRAAKLGKKLSEETRAKMAEAQKLLWKDPLHVAKMTSSRAKR